MKTKVMATSCAVLVWGLVSIVHAQVIAGSPEDLAFQKIEAEANPDSKIALLVDFEKQFPQSKAVREANLQLMNIYQQKNDGPKVIEFGEKVIKIDGDNLAALLTVSRALALEGKSASFDRAIQYAQRALDAVIKLKTLPPQQGFTDDQWREYLADMDARAKAHLSYAKASKR
jgi:hypothetical protein